MVYSILWASIVAMVMFLQYDLRWWVGSVIGVLLIVVSLGFVISGLDREFSGPYSLSYPAMYLMASIGVIVIVASLVTISVRGHVARSALVTTGFLTVFVGFYLLGWALRFAVI